MRKLRRTELLILDDLALYPLDPTDTATCTNPSWNAIASLHDHHLNREPLEMLTMTIDSLLAQSTIDRLQSAAVELVIEGDSYRQRQNPPWPTSPPRTTTTTNVDDSTALHDDQMTTATTTEVVQCS